MATQNTRIQGKIRAVFTNPGGGTFTGVGTETFTWGTGSPNILRFSATTAFDIPLPLGFGNPPSGDPLQILQLGYTYGQRQDNRSSYFSLGRLSYSNNVTTGGESSSVQIDITPEVTSPVGTEPITFSYQLGLNSTENIEGDPQASADFVYLQKDVPPVVLRTTSGAPLTLNIEGFGSIVGGGFSNEVEQFNVLEGDSAQADLVGRFEDPIKSIVESSVSVTTANNNRTITATFTPGFNLTLDEAARLAGYTGFNWYQVVTKDPFPPKTKGGKDPVVPYVDPPLGGYAYQQNGDDNLPYYYNSSELQLPQIKTTNTLNLSDTPTESRLKPGEYLGFTSALVGILPDNTFQILYSFNWRSNYTGKTGGISTRKNLLPPTFGGTGGISNLQLNLNPKDIPIQVRRLMAEDGAINASGAAATSPSPIDFKGKKLGVKLNGKNRADLLKGTNRNDKINAKGGNDRILGNAGSDSLQGEAGRDVLTGGAGNDVLIGGAGNDVLTGGRGNDLFVFTSLSDRTDRILDFTPGLDLIDLSKIFASSTFVGVDVFSRFTEFLQVVSLGTNTQISIDADGAGAGTIFTPLMMLKSVAASSINTKSFVIG